MSHIAVNSIMDRLLRWAGPALAVILIVASLAGLWLAQSRQVQLLSIQSGSMAPLLRKGDAVLVQHTNPNDITPGAIVSYASRQEPGIVITHRVVMVDHTTGRMITAGDANAVADQPANTVYVIGTVRYALPGFGHLLDGLRSWPGLTLAVYIPAALITLSELRRLTRAYLRPTYQLLSYLAKSR